MKQVACSEELGVAAWLRQTARETTPGPLASASQLWWRAEIIRKLVAKEHLAEKATRPLRWSQWAGLALTCLVLSFFLVWLGADFVGTGEALPAAATAGQWLLGLIAVGFVMPLAGLGALWIVSMEG